MIKDFKNVGRETGYLLNFPFVLGTQLHYISQPPLQLYMWPFEF